MKTDGTMTGFPPPEAGQVTLANWRTPPFNRWAFQHVREIVPSAEIANDPDRIWHLPEAPRDLSAVRVDGGDFDAFLAHTDTDAIVVVHRGRIVFERYANGMTRRTPHILMSVSKSMLGVLAAMLADARRLDMGAAVPDIVPELAETAYRGARVADLLDMRAGILFDEDYLATSGPIVQYRKAQGWNPLDPGEAPSDLRSFFSTLVASDGPHRGRFHYVSPNTDLLGWIIERATGERYCDLAGRLLWQRIGAEHPAHITVDRFGAPRCAGGFCATARDLARVGWLLALGGRRDGHAIVPAAWIDDIVANGDRQAWAAGDFARYFPGETMHYRDKWYVLQGDGAPLLFGLGVNGQNLFVDRANAIVVAKFSSQAAAMDAGRIALTGRGISALRAHLARG
jgi:CubicO group peptidase (beta-lactamase class C family)